MRYAIIGAGALGSWIGAKLLADGNEVAFADVGRRRDELLQDGLRYRDERGETRRFESVEIIGDSADAGHFDLLLMCVRTQHVTDALSSWRSLLARESGVVALQTGSRALPMLRNALGDSALIAGFANVDVAMDDTGIAHCAIAPTHGEAGDIPADAVLPRDGSTLGEAALPPDGFTLGEAALPPDGFTLGEAEGRGSWRLDGLLAALQSAGLEARQAPDIEAATAAYLAYRTPIEILCALRRETVAELLAHAKNEWIAVNAECWRAARALHPHLTQPNPGAVAKALLQTRHSLRPAMLRDLDASTRPELEAHLDLLTLELGRTYAKRMTELTGPPLSPSTRPLPVQMVGGARVHE